MSTAEVSHSSGGGLRYEIAAEKDGRAGGQPVPGKAMDFLSCLTVSFRFPMGENWVGLGFFFNLIDRFVMLICCQFTALGIAQLVTAGVGCDPVGWTLPLL